MKKHYIKIATIFIILSLFISLFSNYKVEATFTSADCPYSMTIKKVVAGYINSMAIDEDGNLWTWGNNEYGQLGDGTTTSSSVPIQIKSGTTFKEIAAGNCCSFAIDTSGNLWAWGDNEYGKLGDGTTTQRKSPVKIKSGTTFSKVATRASHTLAIDTSGNLWTWGRNDDGQLGDGTTTQKTSPVKIKSGTKFKEIAAGGSHSMAIDTSGNLWIWGNNSWRQLGNGTSDNSSSPIQIMSGTTITQIAAGGAHSLALDSSGELWMWGYNGYGQLGFVSSDGFVTTPTKASMGVTFTKIQAGAQNSMFINSEGRLWRIGCNVDGELGVGVDGKTSQMDWSGDPNFVDMSGGQNYTLAIDDEGNLWAWGYNSQGQLGNGTTTYSNVPIQITKKVSVYTVTFKNGTTTVKTEEVEEGKSATAPTLTKAGYTLSWNKDFSNVTSNITVNAVWTANKNTSYKVEHYKQNTSLNGYTLADTENKTGTTDALAIAIAKTYTGFTENTSYSGRVQSGNVAGDGSLVLKLYYDRDTYSVTLNTNGGTINSGNVTNYTYGIAKTLPTNVTKTGYTFAGWYSNSSLTGTQVTSIANTETGNKTYYAKWTINQYTVTFKNGADTAKTETVNYGTGATAPDLTKAGYTLSWDKAFSNVTSDLTVNAVWTANTNTAYKVEHYKQNTSLNGYELAETENKTGTTDTTATATAKTYTGFKENTSYSGRVQSGNVAGDGSLVLKLYYDRDTYSVTLNTNEGTINSGNVTNYIYGIDKTLPTNVTKTGYTFAGWYSNSSLTGTQVTSISNTETGNKTYYAKWTINQYTVTFKNGADTAKTETVNYGSGATAPELTKAGYTLSWDKDFSNITNDITVNAVWTANTDTAYRVEHYLRTTDTEVETYQLADTENKTGTTDTTAIAVAKTYEGFTENTSYSGRIASGNIEGNGSLVLKLYYNRNSYSITYELNGGTTSTLIDSYTYGKEMILSNRVIKTGYEFAGWYDNSEFTGSPITKITSTDIGNKSFYAKWTQNEFTVTFKNEGNTLKTETVISGSDATAPALTKAGYTLSWDKDFSNVTSDITVNAVWTANTNTVYKVEHYLRTIDSEVETYQLADTENKTGTTDTTATAVAKTYTGFTENTSYSGRIASGTIAGDGSLVLKLYYNRNSYNITYELNGGTATSTLIDSYTYGKEMVLSNRVTKTGYTFLGWYDNENLTGEPVTKIGITETGDKTFYAKWSTEDEHYMTSEKYNIDEEEKCITKVSPDTDVTTLISKLNTNGTIKIINLKNEEVTGEELIGTGYKLQTTFNGVVREYEIAVRGDLDGNGKITVTDLSMINQVMVDKLKVEGARKKAADIDYNGKTTVTDLSMINQAMVGKLTL